jgi:periplasmic protein TonB
MTARSNGLLLSAVAVSVALHLLLLLLVPWKPMQPRHVSREIVPVRLVHVAPPVRQPLPPKRVVEQSLPERLVAAAPEPITTPASQEISVASLPAVEVEPAPAASVSVEGPAEQAADAAPVARPASTALAPAVTPQPSAEIAAYQAMLSTLRNRALSEIRYPPIARVNGWKGTVILALRLDESGKLLQSVVRQSSGYEVLDRAAIALMRKVTPVGNPLGAPVTIEVPITYEMK